MIDGMGWVEPVCRAPRGPLGSRGPTWAFLLLAALLPVLPVQARPRGTLTVIGEGEVRAAPDIAVVRLGVETFAPAVQPAADENRRRMDAVLAALGRAGVDPKDVQTTSFSISFENPSPETPGVRHEGRYRVTNLVTVIGQRIAEVGTLIDAAMAAGANQVWGIDFSLADPKPAEARARAEAVADARERARQLAAAQGVRLGAVRRMTEQAAQPSPEPRFAAAEGFSAPVTPVAPGEIILRARVEVTYTIE